MPKQVTISPAEMRAKGAVTFTPIPINQYDRSVSDELKAGNFSKHDLLRIQRDMMLIRTFENMLDSVKKQGHYRDIKYDHRGPAHLSMGQEAAAVGQAFLLGIDDHIYGSHRSHGEILAKGLSAIQKLDDNALMNIMRGYFDGDCLRVVEKDAAGDVKSLAIDYLVYGALAEIFAREAGFNKGLGGSMHAFFPPFGIYPNNAIVGGSADISVGAALYKHVNKKPGIVIGNIGDASAGCGPTWEALCFATMDQFKELWEESHRGGLPYIMNFLNNFYGMGGQPYGETMGFKVLARLGAGLTPDQMHAERVDGFNPLAVVDAIRRKKEIIARGEGPVLLDTVTYRFGGHSPSDASSYRDKEEVEAWQQFDPIKTFAANLVEAKVCKEKDIEKMQAEVDEIILKAYKKAIDLDISPRSDLKKTGCLLERVMLSNLRVEKIGEGTPAVRIPLEENPRVKQLAGRSRSGLDENGKPLPKQKCVGLRDALFEAIIDRFYADPSLVAYGEENRDWGGAFAVYRGLTESLPYHRLFNSPISEGAIVGTAVGYALEGGRVLAELMYCDFMGRSGDELFNQLAKWQSMSGGLLKMPVVLRVSVGSKYGAQHSQDWSSMCAHIPGLKVVFPATPYDAKGLMYSSLLGTDPVVFLESQRIYDVPELFHEGGVPAGAYEIPLGEPDIKKSGNDLTVLSIGATLYRAVDAARQLEEKHGVSCEVIDARSIVPFNYEKVLASVKKTRKIVLTSDACERGSALQTFAAKITQYAFDDLDGPPVVVGSRNWITPADEVEDAFFPQPSDIIDAVHEHVLPLKGYTPVRECSTADLMRRSAEGV
ncbi:MAG TPA: thiamine pyrophosphate-dependent enzyme [Candidatus Anammoximicrobium sp.]|nr:thiamine pyrophosphate-dependent enzyme [Candidatus Anammoximicrobium sp.]